MTSDEIAAALASGEAWRVCEAAHEWTKQVRATEGDGGALAEALAPLAGHPSVEVRQEVAAAADLFPEARYVEVIARLERDPSHYVEMAAARAAKRRAARREGRAREDEDLAAMEGMLREVDDVYGPDARRVAERLVRRGRELFTRRLHHEVTKAHTGLETALAWLNGELERARPDREAMRSHTGLAVARMRQLWAIAERARASTSVVVPAFKREGIRAAAEEAIAQLLERVEEPESLDVRVEIDGAITADVDRGALLQAIGNALQNAVEAYGPDAKTRFVEVRARVIEAASRVELSVTDRGVGMDAAMMAELFVPFGSHKPGGTGVGMLIVRKMVEEVHGGVLRLDSAPGAGTKVTMTFPREQR